MQVLDEYVDNKTIDVLDKGYVRFIDKLGTDLSIVNAARASFAKESKEFSNADGKLIHFLVREGHYSPFRHAMVTLEFKAPLMVVRQHWKYVVGSDHTMDGWNEGSRRYITADEEFYVPTAGQWRSAPDNKKQGSGEAVDVDTGHFAFQLLMEDVERQLSHYRWALENNICAEQARLFLPAYGLYTNYRWTASIQSIIHFLNQRLEEDAQKEIRDYAHAVMRIVQPLFPATFTALLGSNII